MSKIEDLISSIASDFRKGKFDKFIHDATFPKFKNFVPNTTVNFRFPITVIVGPNGGGKSSILQAAWGMPQDHSTSRFWFSTPVDPIIDSHDDQNRYWYSHYIKAIDLRVQCRKIAGNKRNGYWEPSRPALKDGMREMPSIQTHTAQFMSNSGDRWNQVTRSVSYINTKAESSAFERFFYDAKANTLQAKQSYFVKYSGLMKRVLDGALTKFMYYGIDRVSQNYLVEGTALNIINKILDKRYKSARYVVHSLYDRENASPSVIFETDSLSYSECFAGSGELAVVNCVLALTKLREFDLLLLDEPETSLHPGAQRNLVEYLLQIVKDKKIQIIISTHSPTFVELLPTDALVVLDESETGITVRNNPSKSSAFYRLGQLAKDKFTILAEDVLLKAVVERAVRMLPVELAKQVMIESASVGASEMLSNQATAYMQANSKVLMVLDGDQRYAQEVYEQDPTNLSINDKKQLLEKMKTNGLSFVDSLVKLDLWMKWCRSRISLIDEVCPEQILLRLMEPGHRTLTKSDATNQDFKNAVRDVLNASGNSSDGKAQYTILKLKLGEANCPSEVSNCVKNLTDRLKRKLEALDAA